MWHVSRPWSLFCARPPLSNLSRTFPSHCNRPQRSCSRTRRRRSRRRTRRCSSSNTFEFQRTPEERQTCLVCARALTGSGRGITPCVSTVIISADCSRCMLSRVPTACGNDYVFSALYDAPEVFVSLAVRSNLIGFEIHAEADTGGYPISCFTRSL